MASSLSNTSRRILEVMKQCPEGITGGEIRERLKIPAAAQANFGRRRDLHAHYVIDKKREGATVPCGYKGPR